MFVILVLLMLIVAVVSWKWALLTLPFLLLHVNQRVRNPSGFIYYLLDERSNRIKIGRTKRNPLLRISKLQGQSPDPLKLVSCYVSQDVVAEELRLHTRYAQCRRHGEWFDVDCMSEVDRTVFGDTKLRVVQ